MAASAMTGSANHVVFIPVELHADGLLELEHRRPVIGDVLDVFHVLRRTMYARAARREKSVSPAAPFSN